MADIEDILDYLSDEIESAVYPNGTTAASIAAADIKIYPGWPIPRDLNTALAAGKVHVTIFPRQDERNVTRFPKEWQESTINDATLTLTASGSTVTVSGTVSVPQACMITFNGETQAYQVQGTDTLSGIAAALAALFTGATSSGAVITFPDVYELEAVVIVAGTSVMETRRQERDIQITIWAPSPALRKTVAQAIDQALSLIQRFTLSDDSSCRLIYRGSPMTDDLDKALIYRRDFIYSVEYPTIVTETNYTIGRNTITTELSSI